MLNNFKKVRVDKHILFEPLAEEPFEYNQPLVEHPSEYNQNQETQSLQVIRK